MTEVERVTDAKATKCVLGEERERRRKQGSMGSQGPFV